MPGHCRSERTVDAGVGRALPRSVPEFVHPKALPKEVIRDLIAIARLLYVAEMGRGGHPVKLQTVEDIGRSL